MTAITAPAASLAAATPRSSARWTLARLEAVRHVRSPLLWIGLLLSAFFVRSSGTVDWQSGAYQGITPAVTPLAAAAFVAAIRSGGRDHHTDLPPLAEEAALDDRARVTARLLGMAPYVAVTVLAIVVMAVATNFVGGYWVGDEPGRTDTALHTLPELLQPVAIVLLAAVLGIAGGRAFRRRSPVAVLGVVVLLALGGISWAWQGVPARYVTLLQIQPVEVTVGPASADPTTFPDEWLLSAPDQYDDDWDRVIAHQPMAAWHDVYLVGLVGAALGLALRGGRGRRLVVAGLAVAAIGVAAQIAVAPDSPASASGAVAVVQP
jgi:hypothetical protein